jgi:L-fuconolactonase
MLIVDGQVHIWAASTPERPWPARHAPHQPVPLGRKELIAEMDAAGVDAAILVPPSWEGERNDLVTEAARLHPDRFAVMGRFDPEQPNARELMKTWCDQPGMLGMRFTFRRKQLEAPLIEGRYDWVWAEMEKLGMPMMVLVIQPQVHLIAKIAERHPGFRIVLDHMTLLTGTTDDEAFRQFDLTLGLAKYPNIALKASALPCFTKDAYPYRALQPHLKRAYDAFGPRRIFWGTDLSRLPCPYRQAVTLFTEELPWLKGQDLEYVMGRGVCEWLGWKI